MKNILVLFSLVVTISAIRVPNDWRNLFSTTVRVNHPRLEENPKQHSQASLEKFINFQPEISRRWNPGYPEKNPKFYKLKPTYYKKPIIKKKRAFIKPNKHIIIKNTINPVPYITYKKPDNIPEHPFFSPPRPIGVFDNIHPIVHNPPKYSQPQQPPREQNQFSFINEPFSLPDVPTQTQSNLNSFNPIKFFNNNPDSKFVPTIQQPNYKSTYQPNPNIINYFDAVKNDEIPGKTAVNPIHFFNNNVNEEVKIQSNENQVTHSNPQNDFKEFSHLYKNYRDDKNFEPEQNDPHYVKEEDPKFEREEVQNPPYSSHEVPQDIPTKPIYPGAGLWAKPGLKFRPFVSKQKYENLKEDEVKPDGYDTFVEGQKVFNETANNLSQRFRAFPDQHKLLNFIHPKPLEDIKSSAESSSAESNEENEENKSESVEGKNSGEEEEFVPTRLYAQVRATEDKMYLPLEEADDGKLREAIKESKIHTVYTEEGYEDSAYDHAGHEKAAENDEGFEDLQREKSEQKAKKVPEAKYINPKFVQRTKLSYGGDLLSDEEIEKIKEEQLGLEDSDVAGTEFEDNPIEINAPTDEDDSEENDETDNEDDTTTEIPKVPIRSNNFISTKETKTMTTKENNDGDTETEISSKVKIILQPTNSTQSQKIVVYPKVYKTIRRKKPSTDEETETDTEIPNSSQDKENKSSEIFIEEILPTTESSFTKFTTTEYQELLDEIPITTLPTTAIPKPMKTSTLDESEDKALKDITKEFLKINKRVKRQTNSKLQEKYPYYYSYKEKGLNADSPLRYSQNMEYIPHKTGKKMVFYEEADKRLPCPEVKNSVDPIPDRVLNAENKYPKAENEEDKNEEESLEDDNNEDTDVKTRRKRETDPQPHGPRLSGLGDTIECLKARYFGENPLDSPFFEEVTVGTIEPIFKELKKTSSKKKRDEESNEIKNTKPVEELIFKNDFNYEKFKKDNFKNIKFKTHENNKKESIKINDPSSNVKKLNDNNNNNKTTPEPTQPSISLLTTPGYTIKLKPKHIYDQIELLEYLPNEQEVSNNKSSSNDIKKKSRQPKVLEEDNIAYESSDDIPVLPEAEELRRRRKIRRKRPPFQIFDVNKFLPTTPKPAIQHFQSVTSQSITSYPTPIYDVPKTPKLQIFDINKYLPTTPPSYRQVVTSSTVLPKYKVLSEVFYKDEIKPNEQLHVFTDILNNIKNSSQDQLQNLDASIQSSEPVSVTLNSKAEFNFKKQVPAYYQDSYLKAYNDQEVDQNYLAPTSTTTSTTIRPTTYRGRFRYKVKKLPDNAVAQSELKNKEFEQQLKLYIALQEAKKKQVHLPQNKDLYLQNNPHLQNNNIYIKNKDVEYTQTIPVTEGNLDHFEQTTNVMGLMPPGTNRFNTIYHPKRENGHHISNPNAIQQNVNKYYVIGLKPPPHQRVYIYSDFLHRNPTTKRITLRRGKRSTNRGSYSSLSRGRDKSKELDTESEADNDDDDDYVPHRSKNYYYDEKTGKIIYVTTKKPQEDIEEEVEYEEIIEEPPASTSKPKQDPIFATATPPPEGKGYVDFVLKLKQDPNYKYIPDPTTTEKGSEPITIKASSTTLKPQSTTPPEFLNILAKVRQSNQYKLIEDKKETKKTKTTESPEVEDEEELDEEEEDYNVPNKNIQNSPGGQIYGNNQDFGIFDVTDFIPKIKNYLPKTSFDTSKYKTIQRSTSRSTTVDDEDEDEEEASKNRDSILEKYHSTTTTTQKPITEENFVIITEETKTKEDEKDSVSKQTEVIPVSIQRRRFTTTRAATTEKPTTKSMFLRRRRPTTTKATTTSTTSTTTSTTTKAPVTSVGKVTHEEKVKRVLRRRPATRRPTTTPLSLLEENNNTTKIVRRRSGTTQTPTVQISSTQKPNNFVERFKKFHRNKKHGGNYKNDNQFENSQQESTKQPAEDELAVNKDVEVIAEYDKTKRHGGNYKKAEEVESPPEEVEDNDEVEDNANSSDNNSLRISLLPKEESDEIEYDEHSEEKPIFSKKLKAEKTSNKPPVTEATLLRLTDVVPKPEAFYSDPTLPKSVNMLAAKNKLSSAEIQEILSTTDSSEVTVNKNNKNKFVVTKKPLIIKDPSKRLYFYAPV